uniref:Anthranilate synthase component 2 n=1 Tax=Lophocladia kuetzingii TaxID=675577 RepID=A0A1Z1MP94_9FLOR|nr:Anthranilate synthase component II [Lophocladia kuetzingii]ARW67571.1 Anthranilate synthase component II [Lophocladia kuetzingii]
MILIIDNYDSFTQNLAQYIGELKCRPIIIRNDEISIDKIQQIQPSHIIISPGPGEPQHSGNCLEVIKHYAQILPILGICLGHQGIGYQYGAKIKSINKPMHGKLSKVIHNEEDIFSNIPNPLTANRYHSLIIDNYNLPEDLEITAWTSDGTIMGCRHKKYKLLRGIQFHPESLWTQDGKNILRNFISL